MHYSGRGQPKHLSPLGRTRNNNHTPLQAPVGDEGHQSCGYVLTRADHGCTAVQPTGYQLTKRREATGGRRTGDTPPQQYHLDAYPTPTQGTGTTTTTTGYQLSTDATVTRGVRIPKPMPPGRPQGPKPDSARRNWEPTRDRRTPPGTVVATSKITKKASFGDLCTPPQFFPVEVATGTSPTKKKATHRQGREDRLAALQVEYQSIRDVALRDPTVRTRQWYRYLGLEAHEHGLKREIDALMLELHPPKEHGAAALTTTTAKMCSGTVPKGPETPLSNSMRFPLWAGDPSHFLKDASRDSLDVLQHTVLPTTEEPFPPVSASPSPTHKNPIVRTEAPNHQPIKEGDTLQWDRGCAAYICLKSLLSHVRSEGGGWTEILLVRRVSDARQCVVKVVTLPGEEATGRSTALAEPQMLKHAQSERVVRYVDTWTGNWRKKEIVVTVMEHIHRGIDLHTHLDAHHRRRIEHWDAMKRLHREHGNPTAAEYERLQDHLHRASYAMLSTDNILRLAREVLRAVSEVHARNVLHNDLKPRNVMVYLDGGGGGGGGDDDDHGVGAGEVRVKLIDFGLSCYLSEAHLRGVGAAGRTKPYVAPELQSPHAVHSVTSEMYAVGAMLFEVLTGRLMGKKFISQTFLPAMQKGQIAELLHNILAFGQIPAYIHDHVKKGTLPEDVLSHAVTAPPCLVSVVAALLSFEPSHRPTAAAALSMLH